MPVAWAGLQLSPPVLLVLWLAPMGAAILFGRLATVGPADFYWPALLALGWVGMVAGLAASWLLARRNAAPHSALPGVMALFAMLAAVALPVMVMVNVMVVPLARDGAFAEGSELSPLAKAIWIGGSCWFFGAQAALLWRASKEPPLLRVTAIALVVGIALAQQWFVPLRHWYPKQPDSTASEEGPRFRLTQEVLEAQSAAMQRDLAALQAQRPGRTDLYAITFAPDAGADVFKRESALVTEVMVTRFGAAGRALQLVSRREDQPAFAWATPLNLQRAIAHLARLMDTQEDVLFIHLTSHGARNGELAASLWPLDVDAVTPQQLKRWLDEAGIRHRVISVSACYSGSWIAPLADENTLIMTAADSEHTSYGCGRRSELTFFGRAVFDEQLRQTRSFEQAHAAAREIIREREQAAKKDDGYSNPQIAVGAGIKARLDQLVQTLEAAPAR